MPDITGAHAEDLPDAAAGAAPPTGSTVPFGTGAVTRTYVVPSGTDTVSLLGAGDQHLRTIERGLPRLDVLARGDEVTVTGPAGDVALALRLLDEMGGVLAGGQPLSADAVERSLSILRDTDGGIRPAQVLTANILSNRGRTIRPKTLNQKRYVDAIDANTITFGIGPAGTGKTYLAMAKAVQALQAKTVNRIVLTRPAVEAGERLGFLPGTLTDKIDPYLRPLYDALHDMVDPDSIPRLITAGTIEVAPLAYMRGRTLNDAFIILDEAQNTSPEQMKMFLTRLGFGSKMVVTGDITQVDLPGSTASGLRVVRDILGRVDDVHFAYLEATDVVRHRLIADIVQAYDRWDGSTPVIDVANESGTQVAGLTEAEVADCARHVLDAMHVHPMAELSVLLVDPGTIAVLHEKWLDLPGPTDVMSFPMDELRPGREGAPSGPGLVGDVVVCPQVAEEQARTAGHSAAEEVLLLVVHGCLHLLGYDHAEPDEEAEMFALQRRLLLEFLARGRGASPDEGGAA